MKGKVSEKVVVLAERWSSLRSSITCQCEGESFRKSGGLNREVVLTQEFNHMSV